ncbi:IclR family transcriptional regulator [Sinanaerobacter sp. ZZT-01]|uniref:IclR family transcriptional regulator n=1 Tax=Sinanaerobacter sp. ZZT-01 TaxID=3111540 RepID=UPI002D78EC11|nr:IclR family transcriptional regulator [Sinanaerobacter sp. ZZT-01]WRR93295.1 IclR family transcriptional regulator [Sinanaerobacter sp. ZZT-01]
MKKVTAINKAIFILNEFTKKPYSYTAKELSEKLGFSKPTVHRILNELEEFRYIRRTYDGLYTIGYKAYQVGIIYANHTDIFLEIRRIIDEVARKTGEQVGYAVLEGTDVVSIYESQMQDSRIRYIAGAVYPINAGCYGKVLMAFSHSINELREIVPNLNLERVSPGAIMDPKVLLKEYEKIIAKGYADSIDEYLDGTVGLGVPVFFHDGSLHGCISLGAIKSKQFDENKENYIKDLLEASRSISLILI